MTAIASMMNDTSVIQKVYGAYFKPETPYAHGSFRYENAMQYGYTDFERREYRTSRALTADEYAAYCGTHCDHLAIPEPFIENYQNENCGAAIEAIEELDTALSLAIEELTK